MAIGAEARKARPVEMAVADPPSLKDARAAVTAASGPGNDRVGAGGVTKTHVFDLDYLDKRGRKWDGQFKCHALTIREKAQVGLTRAQLSAGVPPHMIDVFTGNLLEMLAHCAIALDDAPKWATKLEELHDPAVIEAIYKEVAAHEARFHGAKFGADGGGDGVGPGGDGGADVGGEGGSPVP